MKKLAMVVGALFALTMGCAQAQPIGQNQVTGNECWNAGQGPGGPSQFLCLNTARGGTANSVGTIGGAVTLGTTTTAPAINDGGNFLVTAQPSAATVTWPPNPVPDGAIVGVCNVTGSAWATNVLTPAANTGQTMNTTAAFTTLAAGSCVRYQWNQANATWYRVQ